MRVSLNEIEATCRKAATGAGCPFGIATEVGRAAAWLSARGQDGVGAALAGVRAGWPERREDGAARAVRGGVSAIDFCRAGRGAQALGGIDAPLLLVGLAAAACGARDGLTLSFSGGAVITVGQDGASGWTGDAGLSGRITIETAKPPGASDPATEGAEVVQADWDALQVLALKTYVPESDASRAQGAGAGLLDND